MNPNQFYSYREFCPICNNTLTKSIEYTIQKNSVYKGIVHYKYNDTVFSKSKSASLFETLNNNLYDLFPESLVVPASLEFDGYNIDIAISKECHNTHTYYYSSTIVFSPDPIEVELYLEVLDIGKYRIYNHCDEKLTEIEMDRPRKFGTNLIKFPLISMDKWDLSTIKSFENQIERYMLLK